MEELWGRGPWAQGEDSGMDRSRDETPENIWGLRFRLIEQVKSMPKIVRAWVVTHVMSYMFLRSGPQDMGQQTVNSN